MAQLRARLGERPNHEPLADTLPAAGKEHLSSEQGSMRCPQCSSHIASCFSTLFICKNFCKYLDFFYLILMSIMTLYINGKDD